MRQRGHRDVRLLRQGLYEWIARVLEPRLAVDATPEERTEFERAASLSRFFGGVPRANVARREVPVGYWNGDGAQAGRPSHATRGGRRAETRMLIARLRAREFARLDPTGQVYLDYAGAALYPASLVVRGTRRLTSDRVLGNPHSESGPSRASTARSKPRARLTLRTVRRGPGRLRRRVHRQRQRRDPHCSPRRSRSRPDRVWC